MKRLLMTAAVSALVLGAGASAWAQSSRPVPLGYYAGTTYGHGAWSTDNDAESLNRGIADRNDSAMANYYGSSGVTSSTTTTTVPTTSTTTTWSSTTYGSPYPGAYR